MKSARLSAGTERRLIFGPLVVTLILAGPALAAEFPNRPLTLIVGIGPGSSIDVGARIYADAVAKRLGQNIVVENRPGGAGILALLEVKQASPDGYTLGIAFSANFNTTPWVQKMPLDPPNDLQPVTLAFRFPTYMTVASSVPATDARAYLEQARRSGRELNFGSGGTNSTAHLLGLSIAKQSGVPMQHIPYNSPSQYLMDLSQERIDFQFMPYSTAKPGIEGGTLKFLAVSAPQRTSRFRGVPTLDELGYRGAELTSWYGIVCPKGTPRQLVDALATAFRQAAQDPDLLRRMDMEDTEVITSTPPEFDTFIRADRLKFKAILEEFGLIERR